MISKLWLDGVYEKLKQIFCRISGHYDINIQDINEQFYTILFILQNDANPKIIKILILAMT